MQITYTGLFLDDDEGTLTTTDVKAKFLNGKPQVILTFVPLIRIHTGLWILDRFILGYDRQTYYMKMLLSCLGM